MLILEALELYIRAFLFSRSSLFSSLHILRPTPRFHDTIILLCNIFCLLAFNRSQLILQTLNRSLSNNQSLHIIKMRFSLATAVLSLAAMAAAVPTDMLIARTSPSTTCSNQGGNVQCCLTTDTSTGGLFGTLLNVDGLLQCKQLCLPFTARFVCTC
jgi:hypothetical protein